MKESEIDAEIERVKARKAKLKELLKLQRQTEALEKRYLFTNGSLAKEFKRIAEIVTKHFDVPVACLTKDDRRQAYVVPRHVTISLLRERTGAPLNAISDVVKRDHGSVHFACERVEERMSIDAKFAAEVDALRKACNNGNGNHK